MEFTAPNAQRLTFDRKNYSDKTLLKLYESLIMPRRIEEKMLILLRQGRISKWFSGWGQEAISIGAVNALESDEFILPMHRNLGIFTGRNMPLERLFAQFQGKKVRLHQRPRPILPLWQHRPPHRRDDLTPWSSAGHCGWDWFGA
ncbi:thiamine pyrophosphate-dependent enzyme [Algoriphagus boritolerans]|uniref:thiamine pyrophosphate-dependent enzyme n=1 Tax=Algoriphagus boritolerans TaxID=308111 RepID=UPI000AF52BBF